MYSKINKLLSNKGGNYIFPFFWQHGEDETILRHYMEIIANSNIGAVCVESRPHDDFCGETWWRDMDIILDEARKRQMQVWILDDQHFPTGYANGALESAPLHLRRQSVTYKVLKTIASGESITLNQDEYSHPKAFEKSFIEQHVFSEDLPTFDDETLLSVVALKKGGGEDDITILHESNGQITWSAPDSQQAEWHIYALYLTRNRGPHRNYINMTSHQSCRLLIDAVYEPHYARYKDDFGTTIAGFFSDEPELGNGHLYEMGKSLEDVDDQPWSMEIQEELAKCWGDSWCMYLPLIWEKSFDPSLKAKVRNDYMNAVTRCVEKNFSYQIGDWCRERGVDYIGHVIEDNNQHTRNGSSLGHFFRGMAGQSMAGIDNIGGQVLPQGEDLEVVSLTGDRRDGTFFHYALGKLGASAAAIEPLKKGRAMCENFGNYGWEAGVRLMKYLADHFMVRGINHYVPHAFTPKAFPDPDCPPHFYAHGHNPQYRHFGSLMAYMNRVCELISDGYHVATAAILYHAEADWAGGACMYCQEPAKLLADRQIDYDFIPSDVFTDSKYGTVLGSTLKVNTQDYKVLIVPETSYITSECANAIAELQNKSFPVVFINQLPSGVSNGTVVKLDDLIEYADSINIADIKITPADNRLRYLRYNSGKELYYFVNEGNKAYSGTVTVPSTGNCFIYNAWENVVEVANVSQDEKASYIDINVEPSKSLIIIFDTPPTEPVTPISHKGLQSKALNDNWMRSICTSKEYPDFSQGVEVLLPDNVEESNPKFGGFVRYEKNINIIKPTKTILEITDAAEAVEVFVNGKSAGIQIVPSFIYDITGLLKEGENQLSIEVATTLERVVPKRQRHPSMPVPEPSNKCGLTGNVNLFCKSF